VHHITNNVRIKQIVTEAQDLKLGGYLKAGYPGVVVLKMLAASSFFGWIKGNKSRRGGFGRNLGHHVRGETTCAQRQLPEAFEQLEGYGKLWRAVQGVHDEFREFILQHIATEG
jgi:hypothetical protein